jgi:hypothetical protein
MPTVSTGPYVVAALLCEKVEPKPDGSLDLRGIVDGVVVTPETGHDDPPGVRPAATLHLTAIVSVRAGEVRGAHTLALEGRFPSGARGLSVTRRVELSDEVPGASLVQPLELPVHEPGTYCFIATFDGQPLTRFDLHVRYAGQAS